jgi:hypothetical protein
VHCLPLCPTTPWWQEKLAALNVLTTTSCRSIQHQCVVAFSTEELQLQSNLLLFDEFPCTGRWHRWLYASRTPTLGHHSLTRMQDVHNKLIQALLWGHPITLSGANFRSALCILLCLNQNPVWFRFLVQIYLNEYQYVFLIRIFSTLQQSSEI